MVNTRIVAFLVCLLAAYVGRVLWSQPIGPYPRIWDLDHAALAPNEALNDAQKLVLEHVHTPETVALDAYGNLVSFNGDGMVRISTPVGHLLHEQFVGGRPLAGQVDRKSGRVYIANPVLGLQVLDPVHAKADKPTKGADKAPKYEFTLRLAVNKTGEGPVIFAESVDVSPITGKVYFTDADAGLWPPTPLGDGSFDVITVARIAFLRAARRGALIEYDPQTGQVQVLVSDLRWANGVAVAADGRSVVVCETLAYRLRRVWLEGPRAGQSEILLEGLPGMPDGIARSSRSDGGYWLTIPIPLSPLLRFAMPRPWFRAVLHALPAALIPQEKHTFAFVMAIDADGHPLCSLQGGVDESGSPTAPLVYITAATEAEAEGRLYLTSIEHDHLAVVNTVTLPQCLT